jgi:diacylglycerol kinase family enzyme
LWRDGDRSRINWLTGGVGEGGAIAPEQSRRPRQSAVIVLLNAAAGGAVQMTDRIAARFHAAGCAAEIVTLQRGQDPAEAARAAAVRAPIVVAAGGDGTVSGVAAGLLGTTAVLGVLPLGTLNHFAKDLRLPLDLDQAVAAIAAGRVGHVDIGSVNDRLFINNASIGIYPSIVEVREQLRREGHRKWPAMALAIFRVLRRYRGVFVRIDADGRQLERRTPFVFVGNNEYEVDSIRLGGRTRLDGGRLFAYLAPRLRTREMPMLLARALIGRARQSGAFEILSAAELRVAVPNHRHVRVALDGEITRMTSPLHYRLQPGALRVILPPR